ncbi:hypothetical protein [Herbidospora mongoliensis]|uniref:hypothetical protein n=1 Tax=Herbidospora mongoliensis TaxID=688067 RepID=UPI00082A2E0B|nr:hypothetical protein [Herbidospora mongoliensis]
MGYPDAANRIRQSRILGRELAAAFTRGVEPQAVDVQMALQRDEFCVGHSAALLLYYTDAEAEYLKKSGGYVIGSSPGGFALGAIFSAAKFTSNVVGNQVRKSRAAREAAPQWRPVDQGTIYLTNRRFALQGQAQWHDLWFENIRMSDCDGRIIRLEMVGSPPLGLETINPDWWFVMFNKLAYGKVVMPPDPDLFA